MDSNAKRFLKSSAIYFVGNVLTKVISFFLLPLYTSRIATADMGYYDLTVSYLSILTPVICMEIWSGILRYLYDYEELRDKYKAVFNGLVIFAASLVLYSGLFIVLGFAADIRSLLLIFLYGLFTMLQNIYSYVARGLGYNTTFAVSGIVGSLVNSVSNIIMILGFGMTLNSLYLAMIFGLAVQIIIMESRIKLIKSLSVKLFDSALIKSMIRFSLPLCLNSVSFWFLSGYNRVGISNSLGLDANGLYSVAGKFTYALTLVSICFNMAWQELVFSKGNESDKSDFYTAASNYYIKFLAVGTILFLPAIQVVFPFFVASAYQDAFSFIPLYVLATAVSIFSSFQGNIFSAEKQNGTLMVSTLVAAIVNVVTFHVLAKSIGVQAANVALLAGFTVNVIIRMLLLRKTARIRIDYPFLIGALILFGVACFVYFTRSTLWNILFALTVVALCIYLFRDLLGAAWRAMQSKLHRTDT